MDPRLAVLIVHGIGTQEKGFSQPMEQNIRSNFRKALSHMKQDHRPGQEEALLFVEGLWADIPQAGEEALEHRLFKDPQTDVDWLRSRRFILNHLGDAMSYFKGHADDPYSQYRDIHGRIDGIVRNLSAQTHPRRNTLLTVVSHSLGTVILSDYFYDHRNTLKADQRLVFGNFFTLGSPIALYANRLYDPRRTKNPFADFKPQPVADRWGVWVNLFDEDDLIGYPIRPVNPYCRKVVTADLNVKVGTFLSGWNPLSHLGYWEDETVGKIIAEKLAIDWLRANRWDRTETTEQRIGRYKRRYRMPAGRPRREGAKNQRERGGERPAPEG